MNFDFNYKDLVKEQLERYRYLRGLAYSVEDKGKLKFYRSGVKLMKKLLKHGKT